MSALLERPAVRRSEPYSEYEHLRRLVHRLRLLELIGPAAGSAACAVSWRIATLVHALGYSRAEARQVLREQRMEEP